MKTVIIYKKIYIFLYENFNFPYERRLKFNIKMFLIILVNDLVKLMNRRKALISHKKKLMKSNFESQAESLRL